MPAEDPSSVTPVRLRRRTLFGAAAGGLVALGAGGCGPDKSDDGASAPAEVTRVLAGALGLAAAYQATAQAQPALAGKLNPLETEHRTHISALQTAVGRSAAPSASTAPSAVPPDPTGALAQLRAAEQAAQADAAAACLSAPPGFTALLGSIAACRATHMEALQ